MSGGHRVRPKGGSHLMSRSLAERFNRFKEVRVEGDDRSMEGLEDSSPGAIRYKGSDLPDTETDPPKQSRRQVPATKTDK